MASDGEEYYSGGEDYYTDDDVDSNIDDDGGENWQPESDDDEEIGADKKAVGAVDRYRILTEDEVRARQDADTAKVGELFAIPVGVAAVLLHHYKWSLDELQDKLFSSSSAAAATGVSLDVDPAVSVNAHPLVCGICFEEHAAGEMRSTGCNSHFYCLTCWRGYAHFAILDGARCLSLRCPDTSCSAAVVRELLDDVITDADDKSRYDNFLLRSYIEEGTKFKWYPGRGCSLAVEFIGGGGGDKHNDYNQDDVECTHGHAFCFRCGEEAHRPATCETVVAWAEKNAENSETARWVLANAKHCPKCRLPIEKNQGCMHMTCRPPCLHEFCWLCLGSWVEHKDPNFDSCNVYEQAKANGEATDDKLRTCTSTSGGQRTGRQGREH
uniref:RBR-type E3 ubiquitin transferase n=1 Tax=Leersia perrieri TaxID=77586 RepID=A0A0D9XGP3_9ORYZ